jgi:hypothetical protein
MRFLARLMIVVCVITPIAGQTTENPVWSACVTITAVSNYVAYNNSINLALNPAINGCDGNGITGAVSIVVGQDGVTSSNVTAYLASSLAAQMTGQQVMILYDNSTNNCYGIIVANGGYSGQCP